MVKKPRSAVVVWVWWSGIWPGDADGTDVNSVDRDAKLGVLASGDDAGRIKLFRYEDEEAQQQAPTSSRR